MDKVIDVLCIGTCLLDISTSGLDFDSFMENEPNLAEGIGYDCGGDANNQSVVLSRLGHRVSLLSRVGDDFIGRFLLDTAAASGVDVSHIRIAPNEPTAANNILIGANDKRIYTISKNRTSRTEFCGDDVDLEIVKTARLVSIGSIFVHPKLDQALYTILKTAKENGAVTCADVCPSGESCSLENHRDAMQYLDYLFVNEEEAKYLSGKKDREAIADYFLGLGIGTVVVKLGAKGSLVKTKTRSVFQAPFSVPCVDTTGAGDCYAAGFLSSLLRNQPLEECARFATACSALTIQKIGATKAIQSMQQIADFLQNAIEK